MPTEIREMLDTDWPNVSRIYQQGMDSDIATFETLCPSWEAFNSSHTMNCRYVAICDNNVIAWIALSLISERKAYCGVGNISIYIDNNYQGKGVGTALINHLIEKSEKEGYWTLQSSIMTVNKASIKLHEKCGFRLVGYRERIGQDRYGNWHDTILLERRKR